MKIGFDAKRLFNNFTGLGNYSRFVVEALHKSFPEHEYLLYTPKVKSVADTAYFLQQQSIQVKSPQGLQGTFKGYWRSVQLGKVAVGEGVELFHGLSNELPITKPVGLKTVVTLHDVIYRRYPEFYKPIDRLIYDYKFKKACEKADRIITVSEQTAQDVIRFLGADKDRISVVYQGCHPIFKQSYDVNRIEEARNKFQLPERFVLNVGTIESRKNALLIVKALAQLNEKIPLVIVGRVTSYKEELLQFIHEQRMEAQVRFIHDATFTDLPLIYRSASVFVYPSLFEGFGIPIVEAISSGLPVISSTGSCFTEAGGPDGWYVNPTRADELANAILEVWHGDDRVKQRIERSKKYITRFEPAVIARELMTVYRSVL